jgi:hypothetical protein
MTRLKASGQRAIAALPGKVHQAQDGGKCLDRYVHRLDLVDA